MKLLTLVIITVIGAGVSYSQDAALPPVAMHGSWSNDCNAWGTPAVCSSVWTSGKHSSHVIQEYSILSKDGEIPLFSGRGIYRINEEHVDGYWEDSQGAIHPLSGTYKDDKLSVIWGTPQTALGRSEYVFQSGGLTVRDFILSDKGWREFMVVEYKHAEKAQDTN